MILDKSQKVTAKKSLRTILILWFLLFSILPLAFVTAYSVFIYEKAIDNELSLRLVGNAREISVVLEDYRAGMISKRDDYESDPNLTYALTLNDATKIKQLARDYLQSDLAARLSFFNREGRRIARVSKNPTSEDLKDSEAMTAVFLSEKFMSLLKSNREIFVIEPSRKNGMSLVGISRMLNSQRKHIGYIEQAIDVDQSFLYRLKARLKLEIMVFREDGEILLASNRNFFGEAHLFKKNFLDSRSGENFFDYEGKVGTFGFIFYPVEWGQSYLRIALGASKRESNEALKNVNIAFVGLVGLIVLLLVLTGFVTSNWVLRPLNDLVKALQSFETQEQLITIPVRNQTEIGLLTKSFNQMAQKIWGARSDLRKKIQELESTNKELKDTQTRLVHSAKMVSLGQLVAGVAHELNNPIGFINSNMSHLREYSEKLIELVRIAESRPQDLAQTKQDFEFEYMVEDLPKLINSCQEGARRTKDIVMGLRNFSRLDESQMAEIKTEEALDNTLSLLQGELKNAHIEVIKTYGGLPPIIGFATQINQVFMNILSNAIQAMGSGGKIWITTEDLKDQSKIRVAIQDSGGGISQENLEKIFDPFFTTKGLGSGTGLGLSITYGIIHNHGGEIFVKSEVGLGTEFIVELPYRRTSPRNELKV